MLSDSETVQLLDQEVEDEGDLSLVKSRLEGQLRRRMSKRSLVERNILVDGDPTLLAKKRIITRSLLNKTLENKLAAKYGKPWDSSASRGAQS